MNNDLQVDSSIGQGRPLAALGLPAWLLVLGLALAALIPRTAGLNDFYTIDEGYHWPGRVERFSNALAAGDWAATNQSGHPGVTTMWLGALGRQLAFALGIADPGWAGGGATYLALLRLPLAIVNSLAILAGYALLRLLVGRTGQCRRSHRRIQQGRDSEAGERRPAGRKCRICARSGTVAGAG